MACGSENLFLRRQFALYQERNVTQRPTTRSFRLAMIALGKLFDWSTALVIVKPTTFIRRHRQAFRKWWTWKSRRRDLAQGFWSGAHRGHGDHHMFPSARLPVRGSSSRDWSVLVVN